MPGGLPIKFSNVHYYRVAGKYVYAGDLYIARDNLYFFPEVDMDRQREEIAHYLPHDFALLITLLLICEPTRGRVFFAYGVLEKGLV